MKGQDSVLRVGKKEGRVRMANDVHVLLLYFCDQIMANGVQEIWMRAGVGETTLYLPLHIMSERPGNE